MNWHHFRAFLWLRWRLFVNQTAKGGLLNSIVLAIFVAGACMLAVGLLIGSFLVGFFALSEAPPIVLLLVWDGILFFFIMSWMVGLMVELQRSEAFSLDKFMHLPVSLGSAFVLNYLSSLVCLTTLMFAPAILGLTVGLTLGRHFLLALQLPLAASFVFLVTTLSYQFQGWLATLMVNKRRRRTIIVIVMLIFILIFQAPNLINIFQPWRTWGEEVQEEAKQERLDLTRRLQAKEITREEYRKLLGDLQRERAERGRQKLKEMEDLAWLANVALPPGWVAIGASSAAEGVAWPALVALTGFALAGSASMWRAYRTSLRLYTGQYTAGSKAPPAPAATAPPMPTGPQNAGMLDWHVPWISEEAAGVALATLRSLMRAPEVKMLLLSPVIALVIFGGLLWRGGGDMPEAVRPLVTVGAMAMILFTLGQLAGNQFGYDRGGFKIFVMSPTPRREILLGKNLSLLPLVVTLAFPVVLLVQIMLPLRIDLILALPFVFLTMFLVYCMLANLLSLMAPMPLAAGSLKPASTKLTGFLFHMLFAGLLPIAQGPVLLPFGLEAGLTALGWGGYAPVGLLLALLEFAAVIAIYRVVLTWQGKLLQAREQKILDVVTAKAE